MGNSAMDIASELSWLAERTLLSVRRGSWIVPKRLLGMPADQVIRPWSAVHVPWRVRQPLAQLLLKLTVGSPENLGLPRPERGLFQDHPTITDTVPSRIAHGRGTCKQAVTPRWGSSFTGSPVTQRRTPYVTWTLGRSENGTVCRETRISNECHQSRPRLTCD